MVWYMHTHTQTDRQITRQTDRQTECQQMRQTNGMSFGDRDHVAGTAATRADDKLVACMAATRADDKLGEK